MQKRVFETKSFRRWSKGLLTEAQLCQAAREIEQGLFEADLGAGVCKKRVAVAGRGKSGSTRTLVAKRHPVAVVFLEGREKSEPGRDFSSEVVDMAKELSQQLQRYSGEMLTGLAQAGALVEICHAQKGECNGC